MNEYAALVKWHWEEKTELLRKTPVQVSLFPPQIQHGLAWNWIWASSVGVSWLTTCAVAQPIQGVKKGSTYILIREPKLYGGAHCIDTWSHGGTVLLVLELFFLRRGEAASCPGWYTQGEKASVFHWTGGWVNTRVSPDVMEKGKIDIDIYLASVLSHLVTMDLSILYKLKYSLIKYQ
jgi:hypothetical protein